MLYHSFTMNGPTEMVQNHLEQKSCYINPLKSQAYYILRLIIQYLQGLQCKLAELFFRL